jgi:hypothetical protein
MHDLETAPSIAPLEHCGTKAKLQIHGVLSNVVMPLVMKV